MTVQALLFADYIEGTYILFDKLLVCTYLHDYTFVSGI